MSEERDSNYEEFRRATVSFLEAENNATLMGRAFDVTKNEGREQFAEWLTDIVGRVFDHHAKQECEDC